MDEAVPLPYGATDLRRRAPRMHPPGGDPLARRPAFGDHVLEPSLRAMVEGLVLRPAAVLIPLVLHEGATSVLLTRRTDHLRAHAGQIALPGGKIDPQDEEIGLDRRLVEPIGRLDAYVSTTGYEIVPIVGLVRPNPPLVPNPDEVADVFEVPLAFLMEPQNHVFESREYKGLTRRVYAMPYEDRRIWGVTAGILRLFYEQVFADG